MNRGNLLERLLYRLDKSGPSHPRLGTPCWVWSGWVDPDGYGVLRRGGKQNGAYGVISAHRAAWLVFVGEIPKATPWVLHKCDNPPCCNPDHLFLGTAADNNCDCAQKGRTVKGERHHKAKLSAAQVQEILKQCAEGRPQKDIALEFGVAKSTITYVKQGRTWQGSGDQNEAR